MVQKKKGRKRTDDTALPSCQRFFRGPDTFGARAKRILVYVHVPCRGEVRAEKCGLPYAW
jgi:hypothetical protein